MSIQLKFVPHTLQFNFAAGTSRGVFHEKKIWLIKVYTSENPQCFGVGEVAPIDRLSVDYAVDWEAELDKLTARLAKEDLPANRQEVYALVQSLVPAEQPSLRFALEIALLDWLQGGERLIFPNDFSLKEKTLPINGLVWMGDRAFMKEQIDSKIAAGFTCIKMKIGALDFDTELSLLRYIREQYSNTLTLRVDANGAFRTEECLLKMKKLEEFDLHSIEQPIMPRQPEAMGLLCLKSKVPIALDEELIGVVGMAHKRNLLEEIQPAYIILKPGLLGGFQATAEWIDLAEELGIGWWITSALESNVGLNAICQFTGQYPVTMHQGLGTGQLYHNNIPSPLTIKGERLYYRQDAYWDFTGVGL